MEVGNRVLGIALLTGWLWCLASASQTAEADTAPRSAIPYAARPAAGADLEQDIPPLSVAARMAKMGPVPTIEWLASDADVVVRARVGDVRLPSASHWSRAKARTVETLKGNVPDQFEFTGHSQPKFFANYQGRDVLLFLYRQPIPADHEIGPPPCPLRLPSHGAGWAIIGLDGGPDEFAVTTDDIAVLSNPKSIMAAARAATAYAAGRNRPKSYQAVGTMFGTGLEERVGGMKCLRILFPRDERLEPKAREWTKSPNPEIRLMGAGTMLHLRLRSGENIQVMKGLLSDPYFSGGQYPVRVGAYNILKQWGVDPGRHELGPEARPLDGPGR